MIGPAAAGWQPRCVTETDLPDLPLLEDDLASPGVIEPHRVVAARDLPERAVLCFPRQPVEAAGALAGAVRRDPVVAEHGHHAVWDVPWRGQRLAVVQAGVGAPMAAGVLEEVVARGVRAVVAVGGAGALLPDLVMGHPVVVTSAVRDEGTSFHYAPPSRTIEADPEGVAVLERVLGAAGAPYLLGRAWTTDALFRETRERVERRVAEGCSVVDMEAAALIAVARYRRVAFGQVVYAGDSLAAEWDDRGWSSATDVRQRLFGLAADAALDLPLPRA